MKSAVCIGLNYIGSGNALSGCANDASDFAAALQARGFKTQTLEEPDAEELCGVLRAEVAALKAGDSLVISYSGHGTYIADTSGDEADGVDECICPSDCFSGNLITDDELATLFQSRHRGSRVVLLSDSCHSGTVSRFVNFFDPDAHSSKVRFLPPSALDLPPELQPGPRPLLRSTSPLKSSALLLSGCNDAEYSFDAWFGGRANGAFTRAAIDALSTLPGAGSYRDWWKAIRQRLPSQTYPQSPQLFGTPEQKKWAALA